MRTGSSRGLLVLVTFVALSAGTALAAPEAPEGPGGGPHRGRPSMGAQIGLQRLFAHEATQVEVKPTDAGVAVSITSDDPEVVRGLHTRGARYIEQLQQMIRRARERTRRQPAQARLMALIVQGGVDVKPRKVDDGIVLNFASEKPAVREALREHLPRMVRQGRGREGAREGGRGPEKPEAGARRRRTREPDRDARERRRRAGRELGQTRPVPPEQPAARHPGPRRPEASGPGRSPRRSGPGTRHGFQARRGRPQAPAQRPGRGRGGRLNADPHEQWRQRAMQQPELRRRMVRRRLQQRHARGPQAFGPQRRPGLGAMQQRRFGRGRPGRMGRRAPRGRSRRPRAAGRGQRRGAGGGWQHPQRRAYGRMHPGRDTGARGYRRQGRPAEPWWSSAR